MKIPYFCCIGAELKRYEKDFDFMNQVYLYKVPTDDSIDEVLAEDYFKAISNSVLQDDIVYIYEASAETLHTCRFNKQNGHITAEQMATNIPELAANKILISDSTGHITAGDVSLDYIKNQLLAKVNIDGSSTMTGPLKFRAGSFSGAIAGGLGDGVSIYKIKTDGTIDSEVASLTKTNGFTPGTTNAQNIGSPTLKWKDAHIARVITGIINNGYDIAVPVTNSADTLALKSQVDLAANSGSELYTTGVWYAKMYAATTVPTGAEYNGRKYADFSQTDSGGNPVIKIYTGASGVWTLTETITPPATYNGYITVTSKIWDIAEQAGQQGGKVLWDYTHKTFTPYPQIISFENAALTGTPTAPTPTSSSPNNQIATKEYVDSFSGGADTSLSNLTEQGKYNIAARGKYNPLTTYTAGTVGAAISGKANTDLSNVLADIDFVIESQLPTAQNDYTWYRKYKSGWVEQGCLNCNLPAQSPNTSACATLSMPIVMADSDYHTTWAKTEDGGNTMSLVQIAVNRQTTYCEVWFYSTVSTADASIIDISISGMAAS